MITAIVLEVKNKGKCFITGSRYRETDECMRPSVFICFDRFGTRHEAQSRSGSTLVSTVLHKPPVQIQVPSTACDIISFNGQGQLCLLPCAEWKDLSNHTKMSTIQSRRPEKKAKNHITLTQKFPWKSCFTTHLPFLSSNTKILKAFPKTKCPAREKNQARKVKEQGRKNNKEKKSRLLCHF